MKKMFTKIALTAMMLICGAALTVNAQSYTEKTLQSNVGATAMTKDPAGNIYVIESITAPQSVLDNNGTVYKAAIWEYPVGSTTGTMLGGTNVIPFEDGESTDNYPFGIAIDTRNGNIFVTTYNDYVPIGSDPQQIGQIIKFTNPNATYTNTSGTYASAVWVQGAWNGNAGNGYTGTSGIGDFGALAMDTNNDIFVTAFDQGANSTNGAYELLEYKKDSQSPTVIYTSLGANQLASGDDYSSFTALTVDPNNNIFVATNFDTDYNSHDVSTDGGKILELNGTNYGTVTPIASSTWCSALTTDASGNVYATNGNSAITAFSIVKYTITSYSASTLESGVLDGSGTAQSYYPFGLELDPNNTNIFYAGGGFTSNSDAGNVDMLVAPATLAANNVTFPSIGTTTATISWSNGNGSARAVFINQTNSGSPSPVTNTDYSANTVFKSGTQIGTTGWYCVFNAASGTSVNVTGLTLGTNYEVKVVEYEGTNGSGDENYLSTNGATNNPNGFTTATPAITTAGGTVTLPATTSGTAGTSTSFNISASNLLAGVTVTAPSNVQVSADNSSWGNTATISESNGTLSSVPVYVRLSGSGTVGNISGNVTLSSTSASSVSQAVSGTLNTPPTMINSLTAANSTTTNASSVQYTATFAASVNGLSTSDFSLSTSGVSGASIASVIGSNASYTITVNTGSGNGTIQLFMNSTSGVSPSVSNVPYGGSTYTIYKTQPSVAIGPPSVSYINYSGTVSYTVTWSDPYLNTSTISLSPAQLQFYGSGYTASAGNISITGSGATRTIDITGVTGNGSMSFSIPAGTAQDNAGNNAAASNTTTAVVVDNTPPTITIGAPSVSSVSGNGSSSATYSVTYADANFNNSTLSTSNISLNTSGSANGTVGLTENSSTSYTVTISGITGAGSLGISIAAATASDDAGNTAPAAGPSTAFNVLSNDDNLSNLTLSSGSLNPSFSSNNTSYTATVPYGTNSITVTPTTDYSGATAKVNNNSPSTPVNLSVGQNTVNVLVTAQDGVTQQTYTVTVTEAQALPSTLSNFSFSVGTHPPVFAQGQTSYADTLNTSISSVQITPYATGSTATITLNGVAVASGSPSQPIALYEGQTSTATVVVTAGDNSSQTTYTFTILRLPSTNAHLSFLSVTHVPLSPAFATTTTSYTGSVNNATTSVTLVPTVADANATVTVNGVSVTSGTPSQSISLMAGSNTINTTVTSQGGTMLTYTVVITRAPSSVSTLSNLTVSRGGLSPGFSGANTSYSTTVGNAATSITETPTTTDPTATVTVNGTAVTSGNASGPITLNVGSNTITTVVTAGDGSTTDTYTVTVTRLPSSNANLGFLGLSQVVLTPSFATANTSYTASVPNSLASTNVLPIEVDTTARTQVNGVAVTSGTTTPVTLNVGTTVINAVVTAQDGVTQITYTVTVTRAAPSSAFVVFQPIGVEKPTDNLQLANDGVVVHQGVSPNGDGIDDVLTIDGITNYPDNKLTIINRSGMLVYEAKGYDNSSRTFDGHSNKTGQMQLPGTYFYSLDYTANGVIKHMTGYLVLKY